MLNKLFLALLFVMVVPQTSWGRPCNQAKDVINGNETVTRELHPAGPTTRREWQSGQMEHPYKVQYERIRSGHVLVGKARLIRDQDGIWYVVLADNKRLMLLGRNEKKTVKFKTFTEAKQVWRISVTQQEVPVTQRGVATESEPSLDLVLFLR